MKVGIGLLSQRFAKFPRLPRGGVCRRGGVGKREGGGEWREGKGGSGGGVSHVGSLVDVQRRDNG